MNFKIREDLMMHSLSTVWVELVKKSSKNVLCCGVYREWNTSNPKEDAELILSQFQEGSKENKPLVILGDMNLNSQKWKNSNYEHKEIAHMWRSGLARSGLIIKDMGITFESHGVFNGEKRKSALEYIQKKNLTAAHNVTELLSLKQTCQSMKEYIQEKSHTAANNVTEILSQMRTC